MSHSIVVSNSTKAELLLNGKATEDEFVEIKAGDRSWYTPKIKWAEKPKPEPAVTANSKPNYNDYRIDHWSNSKQWGGS